MDYFCGKVASKQISDHFPSEEGFPLFEYDDEETGLLIVIKMIENGNFEFRVFCDQVSTKAASLSLPLMTLRYIYL